MKCPNCGKDLETDTVKCGCGYTPKEPTSYHFEGNAETPAESENKTACQESGESQAEATTILQPDISENESARECDGGIIDTSDNPADNQPLKKSKKYLIAVCSVCALVLCLIISTAFLLLPKSDSLYSLFPQGLACVKSGDKWGYIDRKDNFVINPQYDIATFFYDEYAVVMNNKKVGAIDHKGKTVLNTEFDAIRVGDFDGIDSADYCIKEGCINRSTYDSQYCTEHKPAKTSTSRYCKYPGCLNKVYSSYLDYCYKHSYLD